MNHTVDKNASASSGFLELGVQLFLYFFRIGWYTFGGGWSIVAQMQKDFVEKQKAMTEEELLNIVSLSRSLPGLMVGNLAYIYGFMKGGFLCGLLAVLGIIVPPVIVLAAITLCYTTVAENQWVAYALIGVRACVAPIILTAVLRLHKGAFSKKIYIAIGAAAFLLSWYWGVSCALIVLMGAAAGWLLNHREGA